MLGAGWRRSATEDIRPRRRRSKKSSPSIHLQVVMMAATLLAIIAGIPNGGCAAFWACAQSADLSWR
jgi:hypothetical protein